MSIHLQDALWWLPRPGLDRDTRNWAKVRAARAAFKHHPDLAAQWAIEGVTT